MRRSDLCKWVESKDFTKGITFLGCGGAFLRVRYGDKYVVGQIESFREGTDIYRVEQRDTKQIVTLKNADKKKEFRLEKVSNCPVTENEFKLFLRTNKHLKLTPEKVAYMKSNLDEVHEIRFDRAKINDIVFKQNLDKIKRGKYKGLNLTDFKLSLLGEVAIAEQAIREAHETN